MLVQMKSGFTRQGLRKMFELISNRTYVGEYFLVFSKYCNTVLLINFVEDPNLNDVVEILTVFSFSQYRYSLQCFPVRPDSTSVTKRDCSLGQLYFTWYFTLLVHLLCDGLAVYDLFVAVT